MAVITITIPDVLKERLSEIENKSGLIASLLNEYFEDDYEGIESLKARKKDLEEETKCRLIKLDEKIKIKEDKLKADEMKKERAEFIKNAQERAERGEI